MNNLLYTKDHEWICCEKKTDTKQVILMGITSYAQEQLGDVVFLEIFDDKKNFKKGEVIGEIESVKSVSNILAPTSGTVLEINSMVIDTPEVVNSSPYKEGWILKYEVDLNENFKELLDVNQYNDYLKTLM
jgi:glycine cleavage system H protein